MDKFYLTDVEKEKLITLNSDELMKGALKKLMLEEIYFMGVIKKDVDVNQNWAYSLGGDTMDIKMKDAELGSLLKATNKGLGALERGFERLLEFKKEEPEPEKAKVNPAE